MRYYIADCHFFHETMNQRMDCRGFESVSAMNDYMIQQWNQKVRDKDDVVILGDFSWGKADETNELLGKLNGKLYLIQGNHDRFLKNKAYDVSRFVWIKPYDEMRDKKRKVVLCHFPILSYNGQYRRDAKGVPSTYMLHGHVHNTVDQSLLDQFVQITRQTKRMGFQGEMESIPCNLLNCFCMYSDYIPLSLDEWIERHEKRLGSPER